MPIKVKHAYEVWSAADAEACLAEQGVELEWTLFDHGVRPMPPSDESCRRAKALRRVADQRLREAIAVAEGECQAT